MAEWSKATDCKSVSKTHVGSNPIFLNINKTYIGVFSTRRQYILFLNTRLKCLYYNNKTLKHPINLPINDFLFFFKTKIIMYHYDNVVLKKIINKIDLIFIKISNFNSLVILFFKNFFFSKTSFWKKSLWFGDSIKFILLNMTNKYILNLIGFFINNSRFNYKLSKVLTLNFKRKRFFPLIRDLSGTTFFNTSLGILSKYLQKGKFFTKKKVVFLLVASLIRKMLLYSSLTDLILIIKRTPMYLQEILSLINNPVSSLYINPFTRKEVNEFDLRNNFT